MTILFINNNNI